MQSPAEILSPAEVPAYILSGGKSTRFGSDKARAIVSGETQLLRLSESLKEDGHPVHVVASTRDRYQDLGIDSIPDERQDEGPAMGLLTAIEHCMASQGTGWLLLISVDQLVWQANWFRSLAGQVNDSVEFVTFCRKRGNGDSWFQPIPGLYHISLRESLVERLAIGRRSLKGLLSSSEGRAIPCDNNPSDWSFNDIATFESLAARVDRAPDNDAE